MVTLAAMTGALVATGVLLLVREVIRREPPPDAVPGALSRVRTGLVGEWRRLVIAAITGMALLALTGWPVVGLAGAAAVFFVPTLTSARAARRRIALLEGLEQWARRLADLLTASRGLEDALEVSARTAPPAIAGPVSALARRLSARTAAREALLGFAEEIGDPAGDQIAAALIIATSQRGGPVRGVLTALAELLARDVAARREIEANRAEHRTAVRWIVSFVGAFTIFAIINRSYSAPYGTLAGEGVLALVAVLYAAGLAWLNRLGSVPGPSRFLTDGKRGAPATGMILRPGGPREDR